MALYRCSLRLATDMVGHPARKWSNTFFFDAANATAAAAAVSAAWTGILRQAADERVYAYEVYATDTLPSSVDFVSLPIAPGDQRGTVAVGERGEPYMPKVCLAVELIVPGSRPSRKFWRFGFRENDIDNGVAANTAVTTLVQNQFTTWVTGVSGMRDVDGQVVTGVGTLRLTTREFGREATNLVPTPPALG